MNSTLTHEPAVYRQQLISDYEGNPFIEALPEVMTKNEVAKRLTHRPSFDPAERNLPAELRLHVLERLRGLRVVLPLYFDVESSISSLIRQGYIHRNPFHPEAVRRVYQARQSGAPWVGCAVSPRASSELLIVGLSGLGKTTLNEAILGCYKPQVIRHTKYQGRALPVTQILWIKVNCPYDGSLSSLCRSFFTEIDNILGTRYSKEFGDPRLSVEHLTQGMQQVAATYALGVLCIDELQNLSIQKSGGRLKMMNFFLNLRAAIGVPILLTGTYRSLSLFESEMRFARRASTRGFKEFSRAPTWGNSVWKLLLTAAFDYQWTKNPVPLTDELKRTLWDLSQGITDVFISLYINAQDLAIRSGVESLNKELFEHTYNTSLRLLHPALNALRSKDPKKLARFDDLYAQAKGESVPLNYEALGLDPATILGDQILRDKKMAEAANHADASDGTKTRSRKSATRNNLELDEQYVDIARQREDVTPILGD